MKILIVQIGRIGDMILTTPLFRAAARQVPGAEIHVLASPRGFPVLQGNPHIKKVIVYRKDPFTLCSLFLRLRLSQYDWWIDPKDHYSRESALLARIGGAKNKAGFNREGKKVFSVSIPSQQENDSLHAAQRNLASLRPLGVSKNSDCRPELFPDARLIKNVHETILADDKKVVLLNISAGDNSRYWPVEKWAAVAGFCMDRGLRVLLTCKPQDAGHAETAARLQPGIQHFHSPTIRHIIALMPHMHLVVTPDTSIVHIASAFDVPQIALFSAVEWNLKKFRPLSSYSVVLQPEKGKRVDSIPAEKVIGEIDKIFRK